MSSNYDFVVTSGGIGPTHDDITYPSIAEAFHKPLYYHEETLSRMEKLAMRRMADQTEDQKTARKRMALFPQDSQVVFVSDDLWVPVVIANNNIHILPGIPRLFTSLLTSLKPRIASRVDPANKQHRFLISTKEPESNIAPYLTELAERVGKFGIKVGSYPRWAGGVMVSLLGKDEEKISTYLAEVEQGVKGIRVNVEEEAREEDERRKDEIQKIKNK
jgi:molybdopterin-biosynthesis enzyme MoeA-like protein